MQGHGLAAAADLPHLDGTILGARDQRTASVGIRDAESRPEKLLLLDLLAGRYVPKFNVTVVGTRSDCPAVRSECHRVDSSSMALKLGALLAAFHVPQLDDGPGGGRQKSTVWRKRDRCSP